MKRREHLVFIDLAGLPDGPHHEIGRHITLAPPMPQPRDPKKLGEVLRTIARKSAPFTVNRGSERLFGSTDDNEMVRVDTILDPSGELHKLHHHILRALLTEFPIDGTLDMTYFGDRYNPHSTRYDEAILPEELCICALSYYSRVDDSSVNVTKIPFAAQ